MPEHIIQAVETMAERQGQPIMKDGSLNFEWRPGVPIHDEHINEIDVGIGFNLEGGDAD